MRTPRILRWHNTCLTYTRLPGTNVLVLKNQLLSEGYLARVK